MLAKAYSASHSIILGLFGINRLPPEKEDDRKKHQIEQAQKARCHRPTLRHGKRAIFEGEGDGSEWRNARAKVKGSRRTLKAAQSKGRYARLIGDLGGVSDAGAFQRAAIEQASAGTAMHTDSIEQLRGTAGARQVKLRTETALAAFTTPSSGGWIMFGKSPS